MTTDPPGDGLQLPVAKNSPIMVLPPLNGSSGAPQAAQPPAATTSFWSQVFFTWILWRVCALGPWIWLLSAVLQKLFGTDVLPCPGWIALTPVLTYLAAQIGRQQLPANWPYWSSFFLNFMGVVVYVILIAPFVWAYVICWRIPKLSTRFASIFHLITHPAASIVFFLLTAGIWLGLIFSDNPVMLSPLIYGEMLSLFLFLVAGLRWASDPLRPCLFLISMVRPVLNSILSVNPRKPTFTSEEEQRWKTSQLKTLDAASTAITYLTGKLQGLARRTIVLLFTWVLVGTYLLVGAAYGGIIFASQRLPEQAFSGLEAHLLKCWAYALTALTTSPIGNVWPTTELGYFIYATELICTFLILTVFFSMFSVAMGIHGRQRSDEIDSASKELLEWIAQERAKVEASERVNKSNQPNPAETQVAK
jgi:hypothetical protein